MMKKKQKYQKKRKQKKLFQDILNTLLKMLSVLFWDMTLINLAQHQKTQLKNSYSKTEKLLKILLK